jgi:hypothetical protein
MRRSPARRLSGERIAAGDREMNKLVGVIVLLVGSVAIGVVTGNIFFRLFTTTVPPAVLTSFNKGTAHAAFITYGLVFGLAIFVWALVVVFCSRFFTGKRASA